MAAGTFTYNALRTKTLKERIKTNKNLGAVSRKPRKLFGPVKPWKNLEPCECRAVLVPYSKDEGRFPSYKKFQAYTLLRF